MTEIGGLVTTSKLRPIVIGPPLTGHGWSAYNGCCTLNLHGNVVLPIGGRLDGSIIARHQDPRRGTVMATRLLWEKLQLARRRRLA